MSQSQATQKDDSDWKCPICKKSIIAGAAEFPFCSDRCRLIDLGRWLDGTYVDRLRPPAAGESEKDDGAE